jgi:hypothetical protein
MAEDLGKVILDILKKFDYRIVSKRKLQNLWLPNTDEIEGLTVFDDKKPTIYILDSLPYDRFSHIQLHEFSHAYVDSIGKRDVGELEIDNNAYLWKQILDGVYK